MSRTMNSLLVTYVEHLEADDVPVRLDAAQYPAQGLPWQLRYPFLIPKSCQRPKGLDTLMMLKISECHSQLLSPEEEHGEDHH
jgi:hypothetical protein